MLTSCFRLPLIARGTFAALLFLALLGLPARAASDGPAEPLCRFGVNHHAGVALNSLPLGALNAGYFIDYLADTADSPPGMQQLRMVRFNQPDKESTHYTTTPSLAAVAALAEAHPGEIWLAGNEPDRRIYQDDMTPAAYARAYHDLYQAVKGADPTAVVVAGNIVQASPLRMQYLDQVLAAYRARYGSAMPVDVWGIHTFVLNEQLGQWGAEIPRGVSATEGWVLRTADNADFGRFVEQITGFRQWMAANGYRNRPLYVTEHGVLMPDGYGFGPFSPAEVSAYMTKTFSYLLETVDVNWGYPADNQRLVQHVSWYSVNDKFNPTTWSGFNGYLFDPNLGNQRSPMGDAYANFTAQQVSQTDLLVSELNFTPAVPLTGTLPITVTVQAVVGNSGNTVSKKAFSLRLYQGNPANGGQLLEGALYTGTLAGCGQTRTYTYTWRNVTPGQYDLYAVVGAGVGVTDVQPANNQLQKTLRFAEKLLFLPILRRQ